VRTFDRIEIRNDVSASSHESEGILLFDGRGYVNAPLQARACTVAKYEKFVDDCGLNVAVFGIISRRENAGFSKEISRRRY
jgi:hypothetical protein